MGITALKGTIGIRESPHTCEARINIGVAGPVCTEGARKCSVDIKEIDAVRCTGASRGAAEQGGSIANISVNSINVAIFLKIEHEVSCCEVFILCTKWCRTENGCNRTGKY